MAFSLRARMGGPGNVIWLVPSRRQRRPDCHVVSPGRWFSGRSGTDRRRRPAKDRDARTDLRRRPAAAGCVRCGAGQRGHLQPAHQEDPAEGAAGQLGDGYRHRVADGDRDGPLRRHRGTAPQPADLRAGRTGRNRETLRGRHGHQSGDLPPGQHVGRGGRHVRPVPDLRAAGHRGRGPAGGHHHQPRHALRGRPVQARRRSDDQSPADHRPGGRQRGRGAGPVAPAQDREAADRRRPRPADRADHSQRLRQDRTASAGDQGQRRPVAGRGRGRASATTPGYGR